MIEVYAIFRPAFEKYFYQALQEFYDDSVMYVEIRSGFSKLYELNGTIYDPVNVAKIFREVIDK